MVQYPLGSSAQLRPNVKLSWASCSLGQLIMVPSLTSFPCFKARLTSREPDNPIGLDTD